MNEMLCGLSKMLQDSTIRKSLDEYIKTRIKEISMEMNQTFPDVRKVWKCENQLDFLYGYYVGKIEEIVFASWSGFLIPKELVVGAKLKPEPRVEPLIPGNFRYKIRASDVEKILEILSQLSILSLDAQLQKNFHTTLEFKDTSISITSKLDNTDEMKSLLNTLKSRGYSGEGLLTISSDTDVSKDLKKWGDDFEQE